MTSAILHHDEEVLLRIDYQVNKMCFYTLLLGMVRV
jgi:hypothetical protein